MLAKSELHPALDEVIDWREKIPRDGVYWQIAEWVYTQVKDKDFAELYSDTGRKPVSPTRVLAAIMLQLIQRLSDRKLEEGSKYDARVKPVLNMSRNDDPLDAVTLCRIRGKLMDSDVGAKRLHKTLTSAIEAGVLPRETTATVDSFLMSGLISGAGATQDTIALMRRAMAKVIMLARCFELEEPIVRVLELKDYLEKGKPKIDWGDPEEKRDLVESLVKDARRVVEVVFGLGAVKQAVGLPHRVAEQNIEERDGKIQIRRGSQGQGDIRHRPRDEPWAQDRLEAGQRIQG